MTLWRSLAIISGSHASGLIQSDVSNVHDDYFILGGTKKATRTKLLLSSTRLTGNCSGNLRITQRMSLDLRQFAAGEQCRLNHGIPNL